LAAAAAARACGCWVHEAIVGRWQVNPHHQDQVTVLPRGARRQQPQLSRALHRRGAITGLKLGVDVPDMVLTVFTDTDSSLAITPARPRCSGATWSASGTPEVLGTCLGACPGRPAVDTVLSVSGLRKSGLAARITVIR